MLNDDGNSAAIVGPQLSDGAVNEFRFLDPPTNATPMRVPVTAGQAAVQKRAK